MGNVVGALGVRRDAPDSAAELINFGAICSVGTEKYINFILFYFHLKEQSPPKR